jgi:hypothetical protein
MRRSSVPAWTRTIVGTVGTGRQHTCATGQRQRRVVCRFTTGTNDSVPAPELALEMRTKRRRSGSDYRGEAGHFSAAVAHHQFPASGDLPSPRPQSARIHYTHRSRTSSSLCRPG